MAIRMRTNITANTNQTSGMTGKLTVGTYSGNNGYSKEQVDEMLTTKANVEHTHDQYLTEHQSLDHLADKYHYHSYNDISDLDEKLEGYANNNIIHPSGLTEEFTQQGFAERIGEMCDNIEIIQTELNYKADSEHYHTQYIDRQDYENQILEYHSSVPYIDWVVLSVLLHSF